jgi:hypothetical protein
MPIFEKLNEKLKLQRRRARFLGRLAGANLQQLELTICPVSQVIIADSHHLRQAFP